MYLILHKSNITLRGDPHASLDSPKKDKNFWIRIWAWVTLSAEGNRQHSTLRTRKSLRFRYRDKKKKLWSGGSKCLVQSHTHTAN